MKKNIILNAGHSIYDPGAISGDKVEGIEAMKIRDGLVKLLKKNFNVYSVPDNLNLYESINWVNERFKNLDDGLALSIHLNAGGGNGAESIYYNGSGQSKYIASTILNEYCEITRYRNRGPLSDAKTRHKRLGWLRDTNPWSTLIECCFVDSKSDMAYLRDNYLNVAIGLHQGILKLYNIEETNKKKELLIKVEEIKNLIINYT